MKRPDPHLESLKSEQKAIRRGVHTMWKRMAETETILQRFMKVESGKMVPAE